MTALAKPFVDQRSSNRAPLAGRVYYRYRDRTDMHASAGCWRDISRRGACIRLGRYLAPGRFLMLETPPSGFDLAPDIQLKGRVVWCRPIEGSSRFLAGLQIYRSEPETVEGLNNLLKEAAGQTTAEFERSRSSDASDRTVQSTWLPALW